MFLLRTTFSFKRIRPFFVLFLFFGMSVPVFASSDPIQTLSGEVSATGFYKEDIEKENIDWRKNYTVDAGHGFWGGANNKFTIVGNKLYVSWNQQELTEGEFNDLVDENGIRAYIIVEFDDNGNFKNKKLGLLGGVWLWNGQC